MKKIPLRARDGTVRAYALVDDEDYETVSAHRWYLGKNGYVMRGRAVYLHRQLLGLAHGDRRQGDHWNLNRLDNRRGNLRICTDGENKQNTRARRTYAGRAPSSTYRGVSFRKDTGRWKAEVGLNGKTHSFGCFDTQDEAAVAAAEGRRRLFTHSEENYAAA